MNPERRCSQIGFANRCESLLALCVMAFACVSGATLFQNDEYGIRAMVPNGLPVCKAEVLSHVHGVGSVLDGSNCQALDRAPSFKIWADFNSAFVATRSMS